MTREPRRQTKGDLLLPAQRVEQAFKLLGPNADRKLIEQAIAAVYVCQFWSEPIADRLLAALRRPYTRRRGEAAKAKKLFDTTKLLMELLDDPELAIAVHLFAVGHQHEFLRFKEELRALNNYAKVHAGKATPETGGLFEVQLPPPPKGRPREIAGRVAAEQAAAVMDHHGLPVTGSRERDPVYLKLTKIFYGYEPDDQTKHLHHHVDAVLRRRRQAGK